MCTGERLTEVLGSAREIPLDDSSKFALFSDCHRGDNSWADDFAHNQNVFFHALNYYCDKGFTYIQIGDGDELWEFRSFDDIRAAHDHVFWMMSRFHEDNRLYLIWGNHDRDWRSPKKVEQYLYRYYDEREGQSKPLFEGIEVHEGLVLRYSDTGNTILLVHGHQGQFLNDSGWWLGRFVVRKVWKAFQLLGVRDPTSPAKNFQIRQRVEEEITKWAEANKQTIIAGHTHRPVFPPAGGPPYFNVGSCVHPRCITGMEIQNGEITLVKWFVNVTCDGTLFIDKDVLEGPRKLQDCFQASRDSGPA